MQQATAGGTEEMPGFAPGVTFVSPQRRPGQAAARRARLDRPLSPRQPAVPSSSHEYSTAPRDKMTSTRAVSCVGRMLTKVSAKAPRISARWPRSVIRQLDSLFDGSSVAGLTDRQLLERFTARRDAGAEVAFTALVAMHGPMVLGICRQILGDRHHAEDAFQAVFLVLACKAPSLRNPDLLGNWLYGVALRTAHKARARLSRQRQREEGDAMSGPGADTIIEPTVPPADAIAIAREEAELLHGEIARLPRPLRLPLVLCCFEGLTVDQVARRLRCPVGTVGAGSRGAQQVPPRAHPTRRGLVIGGTGRNTRSSIRLGVSLHSALQDHGPGPIGFAARGTTGETASSVAAALAKEVLGSMLLHSVKVTASTLLILGKSPPARGC